MFCSGEIGGYPYIVMPGSGVLHLCDPRKPMRTVTMTGSQLKKHIPNPACYHGYRSAGRFDAEREKEANGRRVCRVCLKNYQNYATQLSNQLHSTMMVLRGW